MVLLSAVECCKLLYSWSALRGVQNSIHTFLPVAMWLLRYIVVYKCDTVTAL